MFITDSEYCNKMLCFFPIRYVCYRVFIKGEESQSLQALVSYSFSPGMIRVMEFNDTALDRTHYIQVVLGVKDKFPYRELVNTNYLNRNYNLSRQTAQSNYIVSHNYKMETESLPSPYETKCFDYGGTEFDNEVDCRQDCIRRKTKEIFNKVPFTVVTMASSEEKMVSDIDLRNETLDRVFKEIMVDCSLGRCSHSPCSHSQVMTVSIARRGPQFRWKHVISSQPSFRIITVPNTQVYEFIIYLLSMISTWTGLNVLAMNPVILWKKARGVRKKKRSDSFTSSVILSLAQRVHRLEQQQVNKSKRDSSAAQGEKTYKSPWSVR